MSSAAPTDTFSATQDTGRVLVWDIPVRVFHWTLVTLIISLFITGEILDGAMELHATLGRAVLALVFFRLLWGIVGSSYARFSKFVRSPVVVINYVRSLFAHKYEFIAGHNPLGGWMVLALLFVVMTQATLGLFANDEVLFDGPFARLVSKETSDLITGLHGDLFNILLFLVGLHVTAVIWHKLFKGENLIPAMFIGYKELPPGVNAESAQGGGALLALVLLAFSVAVVYWLSQ